MCNIIGFQVFLLIWIIVCFKVAIANEFTCGRPLGVEFRLLPEDRIVAGYDVGYYRYPWYAALIRFNMVSCGGALIAPGTVVTAAHCYKDFIKAAKKGYRPLESFYTVRMGIYNICQTESTQKEYKIEKVIIHSNYFKKMPYYDICLLKLTGNTDQYQPICLPPPNLKKKPIDATVPGLGTLRYHGAMPCTVHEARLLIYNDTVCRAMMNKTGNDARIMEKSFCAGYLQGGIDTCQGDSGGPLQSMSPEGDFVLIGIVSFGFRCAAPGMLGVYTDVSQYIDWIKEKSGIDIPTYSNSISTSGESDAKPIKRPTGKPPKTVNGQGSIGGGGVHLTRPFRRPVRIIIVRNNHLQPVTRVLLHHPIIRHKQRKNP
uniref:Trypsin-1-like n=1 Tax=Diabrotica virgifera virgifera TaxID=50390 RepID=A0A6P7FUB0_DIAVI